MSWETMTQLEQTAALWWDLYKDAHGVRPRGIDTSSWTQEQFDSEFEYLEGVIKQNEARRQEDEAVAVVRFEDRIARTMDLGAHDREMALRWIHEAERSQGDDEFLCYCVGLPYGYFKSKV